MCMYGAIEALSSSDMKETKIVQECEQQTDLPEEENETARATHIRHCGQPSNASKFPTLVDIAADFVKQHGFAAQNRIRNELNAIKAT